MRAGLSSRAFRSVPALAAAILLAPVGAFADEPLDARVGSLGERLQGMPAGSEPAQNIVSAEVRQDMLKDRVSGTIVLAGTPTGASDAIVSVQFGSYDGAFCSDDVVTFVSPSTLSPSRGFLRSGRTITFDIASDQAGYKDWECATAGLVAAEPARLLDGLTGKLQAVPAEPKLRLGKPTLIGAPARPLELVPGVWTTIEVPVINDGRVEAVKTILRGGGKDVRARTVRVGDVDTGQTTAAIDVRLGQARDTTLTLTVKSGAVSNALKIPVKAIPAPPRPVDGRYRSADGKITFRIARGRVVDWHGDRLQMWCNPPGATPTYLPISVSFPTTPVPKNGIVDAVQRYSKGDAWYNAWMSMRVAGKAASSGEYTYVTAGYCRASLDFKARWVGR